MTRSPIRLLATAALLLAPLAAARADQAGADRPPVVPDRDATVTYALKAAGHQQQIEVRFAGDGQKLRIDNPQAFGDMIFDKSNSTMTVIMQQPHAYMVVPMTAGQQNPFLLDPDQHFQRLGTTETIAGVRCDDWQVTSPHGQARACVTDWGLLLSQSGSDPSGDTGSVVATSVSTAPLPPGTFLPPAGFQRLSHPNQ